jgi:hypothetical protein
MLMRWSAWGDGSGPRIWYNESWAVSLHARTPHVSSEAFAAFGARVTSILHWQNEATCGQTCYSAYAAERMVLVYPDEDAMSMELYVLLSSSKLPTVQEWQTAIHVHGFDLVLDPTLNLHTDAGFTPAIYKGQETGFEFDLSPASEIADSYSIVGDLLEARDRSANFRWGSELSECAAATIAAAVLATLSEGIIYDPQEDVAYRDAAAITIAQQTVQNIDRLQS